MKTLKNNLLLKVSVAFVFLMLSGSAAVFAQQAGDPGNAGPTPTNSTTPVPVDGGASILAAAGIGYGMKRIKAMRKAKAAKKGQLAG